jgi:hypothetical protein
MSSYSKPFRLLYYPCGNQNFFERTLAKAGANFWNEQFGLRRGEDSQPKPVSTWIFENVDLWSFFVVLKKPLVSKFALSTILAPISFEHRGVGHIESIASRFEMLSSISDLLNTFVIEWYIDLSCESIGLVPHGLAIFFEDYLVNFFLSSHLIIIDIRLEKM